jgi:hypothetical protein
MQLLFWYLSINEVELGIFVLSRVLLKGQNSGFNHVNRAHTGDGFEASIKLTPMFITTDGFQVIGFVRFQTFTALQNHFSQKVIVLRGDGCFGV